MRHESVFLLVLPSGAGGCLYCTGADEARARARPVTREGWLFRHLSAPQPLERQARSAISKVELVETFGRPDPALLAEALARAGARLSLRLEVAYPETLTVPPVQAGGRAVNASDQ